MIIVEKEYGEIMSQTSLRIRLKVDKEDLRELIKSIMDGSRRLYLPQFQRTFEWQGDDVKYLIDSIIRNLPIGSIILWKPKRKIEDDPFAIPIIDVKSDEESGESYYVLDGQQRLTSLLLLYMGWSFKRGGKPIGGPKYAISYVPSKNMVVRGSRRGIDLSSLFRAYLDGKFDSVVADYPGYKDEIEDIIRRIVNYEIPIYTIETLRDDESILGEMADAFIRINRAGVRIGLVELMLSFLAGTISGELGKGIREIHNKLKKYDIDLNIIIRFVLSNFGISQTVFSNVNRFKASIGMIDYDKSSLIRSEKALSIMFDFLHQELGINSCRIIPSSVALIPIAAFLYERNVDSIDDISNSERRLIANWFMLVNLKGYYSSSTNSKLQKDLEVIRKSHNSFPYHEFINNLGERQKIRKVDIEKGNMLNVLRKQGLQYLFLLYVLLAKERAEDLDGCLISSIQYSDLHRHHIFPRNVLLESGIVPDDPDEREAFISGLGNITFIGRTFNEELLDKPPSEYLPEYPALKKHFIPQSKELWEIDKFEDFKQKRIEEIYEAMKKHFPEITE